MHILMKAFRGRASGDAKRKILWVLMDLPRILVIPPANKAPAGFPDGTLACSGAADACSPAALRPKHCVTEELSRCPV